MAAGPSPPATPGKAGDNAYARFQAIAVDFADGATPEAARGVVPA